MSAALLTLNSGSSSLKFAVYENADATPLIGRGEVTNLGPDARLRTRVEDDSGAHTDESPAQAADAAAALEVVLHWVRMQFPALRFDAIGHRVVHGGSQFRDACIVDDANLHRLERLDPLAPQHQPFNLAGIREARRRFPGAVQVACFDTAFHAGWDDRAQRIALPRAFHDAGVRRYGFHGLSYEYLSGRLSALLPEARRAVLAHLGAGASLCALRDGVSVDSTMGFSVLDGVPMATRCGEIDPGAVFHLHRGHALEFERIEHLLYYESGLLGVSGISGDMRTLLASGAVEADQAVELFAYRCVQAIGALAAVLGGIDALVFSGGIGAHAPAIRARICASLGFLGIAIDGARNNANAERIDDKASVPVFALATDEERVIAGHCRAVWCRERASRATA